MLIESLELIAAWMFQQFLSMFNLYTAGTVLVFPLVLWLLDRIFGIFDYLKR